MHELRKKSKQTEETISTRSFMCVCMIKEEKTPIILAELYAYTYYTNILINRLTILDKKNFSLRIEYYHRLQFIFHKLIKNVTEKILYLNSSRSLSLYLLKYKLIVAAVLLLLEMQWNENYINSIR